MIRTCPYSVFDTVLGGSQAYTCAREMGLDNKNPRSDHFCDGAARLRLLAPNFS